MRNYLNSINPFIDSLFFGDKECDSRLMRTDIIEHENEYILNIEVPAVEKKDIKVSLNDSKLTVSVNKEETADEGSYLLRERRYGNYSRTYYVGDDVKFNNISAKLDNGVLTLTITKAKPEEKEDQYVEIQ